MFESSTRAVNIVGGAINYYEEYTATNLYVERPLGGLVNTITVTNDSTTDTASISFDGATLEADLKPGESITMHTQTMNKVYLKGNAGGGAIRLWGW